MIVARLFLSTLEGNANPNSTSVSIMLHTLPETESSPRAGSFGQSQISTSRWSPSSPRAQHLALGEGLAHGEQHLHRELSTLSSRRRVRLTAQQQPSRPPTSVKFAESLEVPLSAKKKHTAQKHFHRELYTFDECFVSAHGEFSKKISHFRVQTFSLIHIHSNNILVQNWHHFVLVIYI
jgi:hypothetical protein